MKLYFHGTEKKNLKKILKKGFKTESGRATFTMNPQYTFSFSTKQTRGTKKKIEDYSPIIKNGMMLVFNIPEKLMKVAIDSNLVFIKEKKIITGWPNRFKTEQFGYFEGKNGKRITIPEKYLVGAYSYNLEFIDAIKKISQEIVGGKISRNSMKKNILILEKILSKPNLWLINPRMISHDLASSILEGMIRNLVAREIRQSYLRKMNNYGWKIENYGNHPVKLKDEKQVKESIRNMKKIINQSFITSDLKEEFKEGEAKMKPEVKKEVKLLWPFYLESIVFNLFFILMPFETLYFLSIGLAPTKIGLIIAMWPLAMLITDIPTGAIADIYGRKFSVILGFVISGLLFLIIPFVQGYAWLLLIYAFLGVANTFMTGSYDAWVVDLLKSEKLKSRIKAFFSKYQIFLNLAIIFTGLIGTYLVFVFGLKVIWFASAFGFLISAVILFMAKEKYIKQKFVNVKKSFSDAFSQAKEAVRYSFKHPVLFYLIFASFILAIACNFDEFLTWTPFLKQFLLPDSWFGYLLSLSSIVGVFALLFSNKLSRKLGEKRALILITLLGALAGLLILVVNSLITLILLFLSTYFLANIIIPIRENYFHNFIPSKMRATIGSIDSMFNSIGSIIFFIVAGFLVDHIGARYTIALTSSLMIIVVIFYWRIKENK